jgi:threonine dehydrogenase-like Zn-dependent dehydrogenase
MKAVFVSGEKLTIRQDYPRPIRGAGEALIKVRVAGICTTDPELLHEDMDFYGVPGHEFVGSVEDADATDLIGKRVVGEINCPCGHCQLCRLGLGRHCRNRTALGLWKRDGAFAEFLTLPERNLHVVPDEVPDETAVFTEPASTAFAAFEQAKPKAGERVVIAGDGWLGLLCAQVFAAHTKVTVLGLNPARSAIARGLGFETVAIGASLERDFDVAIETTGLGAGMRNGLDLLRPAGTLVLTTTILGDTPVPLWKISTGEINLIGLRGGTFPKAVQALRSGAVKTAALVSARYRLDDFEQALAKSKEPDALKILVYPAGVP